MKEKDARGVADARFEPARAKLRAWLVKRAGDPTPSAASARPSAASGAEERSTSRPAERSRGRGPDARPRRDPRLRLREGLSEAARDLRLARPPDPASSAPLASCYGSRSLGRGDLGRSARRHRRQGARIRATHGPDSIAMYVGTAPGFGVLAPDLRAGLHDRPRLEAACTPRPRRTARTSSPSPPDLRLPVHQPFPDLERTRLPDHRRRQPGRLEVELPAGPNPTQHLQEMRRAAVRSGSSTRAAPRPPSAPASTSSSAPTPTSSSTCRSSTSSRQLGRAAHRSRPVESATRAASTRSPGWRAPGPGAHAPSHRDPAERLRAMVDDFARARRRGALLLDRRQHGPQRLAGFWLQEAINAVSGNLDRRGGTLVGRGVIDFPAFGKRTARCSATIAPASAASRSVNDAFPGGILADEILTPGEARCARSSSPAATRSSRWPTLGACARPSKSSSCWSPSTSSATRPARSPLRAAGHRPARAPRPPFIFPLMLGLQRKPYLQATRAITKPDGEQRDEATIYLDLCRASGASLFGSGVASAGARGAPRRWHALAASEAGPSSPPARTSAALDCSAPRITGQGSLRRAAPSTRTACCVRPRARRRSSDARRHRRRQGPPRAPRC
jgi:hypothetical protein